MKERGSFEVVIDTGAVNEDPSLLSKVAWEEQ